MFVFPAALKCRSREGVSSDYKPNAFYYGPYCYIDGTDPECGEVAVHETMHVFGALDQYVSGETWFRNPTTYFGYLDCVNANSAYSDGKGYFQGKGEEQDDVMVQHSGPIGVYSRGQIGWRDSDGDGILDPQDTFPDTLNLTRSTTYPYAYTGKAIDKPLKFCDLSWTCFLRKADITINSIKSVEYRVNGGAWCAAEPGVDGSFDSGEEQFLFILPFLSQGNYKIEVRATNSVGNIETSYAKDEFSVPKNALTNTTPFAAFSVTPPKGSIATNFILDASSSSDVEDDVSKLQVSWDFNNDGIWDTDYAETKIASYKYSTSGNKTILLQVKDSKGATKTITKKIQVAATNLSPEASFTVTPENQHGENYFTITLDATGCWDAENNKEDLVLSWDFEDDGSYDVSGSFSEKAVIDHSYFVDGDTSKRFRIRLKVEDKNSHVSTATRDIWCNTYNHAPLPRIQKNSDTDFTVVVDDFDQNTTWDGLSAYRWDYENDGIWDTQFFAWDHRPLAGSNKLTVSPDRYGSTIICEVRDRFSATNKVAFYTKPFTPIVTDEGEVAPSAAFFVYWNYEKPSLTVSDEYLWQVTESQYKITKDSPQGTVIAEGVNTRQVSRDEPYAGRYFNSNGLTFECGKKYYVGIREKNTLGVYSDWGYSDGITFPDVTPPVTPVVADGGIYNTNLTTLTASWTSSDPESGIIEYQYAIGIAKGAIDVVTWTSFGKNTLLIRPGLSLINGKTYYFSVKAKNGGGLWSGSGYSDGITVDTAAPTSGTIKINNDAVYTTSASVTLTLSAFDVLSGMGSGAQMQFSTNNVSWTAYTYATSKTYTLPAGNGVKTVYAKFKDVAGNWSSVVSDTIILDSTSPQITHTPISSAPKNKDITFTATVTDAESGVQNVTLYWYKKVLKLFGWKWSDRRSVDMISQGGNVYKATLLANQVEDRQIKYYIEVKDKAGNAKTTGTYIISR